MRGPAGWWREWRRRRQIERIRVRLHTGRTGMVEMTGGGYPRKDLSWTAASAAPPPHLTITMFSSDPQRDDDMSDDQRFNTGPGGSVDLANLFTYHPPFGDQVERYQEIRSFGRDLAISIEQSCPPSPERTTALAKVREAVMWANASIACNERPPVEGEST